MGFFDDLSKKASETYKNTTEKTSKLTREMKLKSSINENKAKIEKIYAEIGKKVYEKHLREENIDIKADLIEECSKLDAYAKEIEDMRTEMLALKDLRICKGCATEIPVNAKFCPKCGTVQDEIQINTPMQQPAAPVQQPVAPVQEPATEIIVKDEGVVEINNNQPDNNQQ